MSAEMIPLWRSLAGGALIGGGAAVLILFDGAVAGISAIAGRVLRGDWGSQLWRAAFLLGLLLPAAVLGVGAVSWQAPTSVLALGGLLVGFGTTLGSGCTSGHGVCGTANLSLRSVVATVIFILAGALSVFILKRLVGA